MSSLDAPILSQETNQARRGSLKRPDAPGEQPLVKQAQAAAFFEPEIDHFVMAITAAEAIVRHTALHRTACAAANVWTADHVVYLALYRYRLCWRLRRRTPRPADGEAAN